MGKTSIEGHLTIDTNTIFNNSSNLSIRASKMDKLRVHISKVALNAVESHISQRHPGVVSNVMLIQASSIDINIKNWNQH